MNIPELIIGFLAIISGISSLTVAGYILSRNKTPLLSWYTLSCLAIFSMTLGFALRSIETTLLWMATGSLHEPLIKQIAGLLTHLSFMCQTIGGLLLTVVMPFFTSSIFGQPPELWYRRMGIISAIIIVPLSLILALQPQNQLPAFLLSGILFINIALALVMSILKVRRIRKYHPAQIQTLVYPGFSKKLKGFLLISVVFLPLFLGDILISTLPIHSWLRGLDNTSLPLYFLIINLGSLGFLRHNLDHPPLMENDSVTDYGKDVFKLTERETEVLEYILEGFTVKDLAGVLKISPKTTENHLYSIYQKTGVTNRIQLFHSFRNQRTES